MKARLLQKQVNKALSAVSRFAGGKVQLPVLSNILITAKNNKVSFSATNLESSIIYSIGAKVEKEGDITIPARTIADLTGSLKDEAIDFEAKEEKLKIECGGFSSTLLGINSSDFPTIPQNPGKNLFTLKLKDLNSISKNNLFCVSTDDTRPVLTGILVIQKEGKLVFVSTDGFRLSQFVVAREKAGKREGEERIIIPKNVWAEVGRISGDSGEVKIGFDTENNQAVFLIGDDVVVSSRVIQGEFPDFERIIPKESKIEVNLDKEELMRAVKLASVFARDAGNIIKLTIQKGKVEISAESAKSGSQKTTVEAKTEITGEEFSIAYNYRYLEEFIGSVEGESLTMKFSDENAPGIFLDDSEKNYLHIIMPVKTG